MYDQIIIAVSYVETAGQMLEVASRLIDPNGTMNVLHVIEVPYHLPYSYADDEREKARRLLEGLMICPRDKPNVNMRYSIIAARSAAEVIVEKAKQWGCGLVLMGTSARTIGQSVLLGDVFNYVIKNAPCEIMSVSSVQGTEIRFKKILVPTSGYKHSERAAEVAKNLVDTPGGSVTAIYVTEGDINQEAIDKIASPFNELNIKFKAVVKKGPVAQTIIEEAEQGDYDLLMIGATERPRRLKFILGSVADEIVKNAPIRVIVVRTK
ncbi:MAG: universal stress protein [Halobacteriota archaeon]